MFMCVFPFAVTEERDESKVKRMRRRESNLVARAVHSASSRSAVTCLSVTFLT